MSARDELEARKAALVERLGPWEADNIHLGHGVYTIAPGLVGGPAARAPAMLQVAGDVSGRPWSELRVLDLGAAEGLFAIEAARRGASVVAIEGRATSVERAAFARDALGLEGIELLCEDVRTLDAERHGRFDVVLCLGILYHLPAPDVLEFVHRLAGVTRGVAVVDTHVSLLPSRNEDYGGRRYSGASYREHDPDTSMDERAAEARASLDNPSSFWLTRPSLYNLLADAGFHSVLEVRTPRSLLIPDRVTLVGVRRGESAPSGPAGPRWRERELLLPAPLLGGPIAALLRRLLPRPLRGRLRRLLP